MFASGKKKKNTHIKEKGPRRGKQARSLFVSIVACIKHWGRDQIRKHAGNSTGHLRRLHRRLCKDSNQLSKCLR